MKLYALFILSLLFLNSWGTSLASALRLNPQGEKVGLETACKLQSRIIGILGPSATLLSSSMGSSVSGLASSEASAPKAVAQVTGPLLTTSTTNLGFGHITSGASTKGVSSYYPLQAGGFTPSSTKLNLAVSPTPTTLNTITTSSSSSGHVELSPPATVTSSFIPDTDLYPLAGVQRGTKCFGGLFIETGGDLYNLTCDVQAPGGRVFAGIYGSITVCAKKCSVLRANGSECDGVIFNTKIMGRRALAERAGPVNCYGLTDITGADVKVMVDTAVFVPRNYTLIPGGIKLGPVFPQYSLTKPPAAPPPNTFADPASSSSISPSFYSAWPQSSTVTDPPIMMTFTLPDFVSGTSLEPISSPTSQISARNSSPIPSGVVLPSSANRGSPPGSSPPLCRNPEIISNGGFESLMNEFPDPWEFLLDFAAPEYTTVKVQQMSPDPSDLTM